MYMSMLYTHICVNIAVAVHSPGSVGGGGRVRQDRSVVLYIYIYTYMYVCI